MLNEVIDAAIMLLAFIITVGAGNGIIHLIYRKKQGDNR